MGVHIGEADERDGNYFGTSVNVAAWVMSAGSGGQVLMSDPAPVAARVTGRDLGRHLLKG